MKRKYSLFSCLILFYWGNYSLFAQEIAPFQSLEPQAIDITSEVLAQVLDKTWYCTTRKYVEKKKSINRPMGGSTLTISDDGLFEHNTLEGTWYIESDKLIVLEVDREDFEKSKNAFIIGGFSVLKVNEDELILRKTLTSDFGSEFTYFLESEKRYKSRQKKINSMTYISPQSRKKLDRWGKELNEDLREDNLIIEKTDVLESDLEALTRDLNRPELIEIIKSELQKRNLPYDHSIEELPEEKLREKLNKLNKG